MPKIKIGKRIKYAVGGGLNVGGSPNLAGTYGPNSDPSGLVPQPLESALEPLRGTAGDLRGYQPGVSSGVASRLSSTQLDPAVLRNLREINTSGLLTDVSPALQAAQQEGANLFEDLQSQIMEGLAATGGLGSSAQAGRLSDAAQRVASNVGIEGLRARVAAAEAASNRRLGGLGPGVDAGRLEQSAALGLGGLEQAAQGQRIDALSRAGGLYGDVADLTSRVPQQPIGGGFAALQRPSGGIFGGGGFSNAVPSIVRGPGKSYGRYGAGPVYDPAAQYSTLGSDFAALYRPAYGGALTGSDLAARSRALAYLGPDNLAAGSRSAGQGLVALAGSQPDPGLVALNQGINPFYPSGADGGMMKTAPLGGLLPYGQEGSGGTVPGILPEVDSTLTAVMPGELIVDADTAAAISSGQITPEVLKKLQDLTKATVKDRPVKDVAGDIVNALGIRPGSSELQHQRRARSLAQSALVLDPQGSRENFIASGAPQVIDANLRAMEEQQLQAGQLEANLISQLTQLQSQQEQSRRSEQLRRDEIDVQKERNRIYEEGQQADSFEIARRIALDPNSTPEELERAYSVLSPSRATGNLNQDLDNKRADIQAAVMIRNAYANDRISKEEANELLRKLNQGEIKGSMLERIWNFAGDLITKGPAAAIAGGAESSIAGGENPAQLQDPREEMYRQVDEAFRRAAGGQLGGS